MKQSCCSQSSRAAGSLDMSAASVGWELSGNQSPFGSCGHRYIKRETCPTTCEVYLFVQQRIRRVPQQRLHRIVRDQKRTRPWHWTASSKRAELRQGSVFPEPHERGSARPNREECRGQARARSVRRSRFRAARPVLTAPRY